jgi:dolichol-phosphate mannosyltransferase
MSPRLSVVIPCYNEESSIARLRRRLEALALFQTGELEIILVDDGSHDSTWKQISSWAGEKAGITAVKLAGNRGNQTALLSGISRAGGGAVAVMDADLQDPPENLEPMLELLEGRRVDAVVGIKKRRLDPQAWVRMLKTAATAAFPLRPGEGDFCVLSREAAASLLNFGGANMPFRVRRYWALKGRPSAPFPYDPSPREQGASKQNLQRLLKLWVQMLRGFYGPAPEPSRFQPPIEAVASR